VIRWDSEVAKRGVIVAVSMVATMTVAAVLCDKTSKKSVRMTKKEREENGAYRFVVPLPPSAASTGRRSNNNSRL
jgi:hypothetical protein